MVGEREWEEEDGREESQREGTGGDGSGKEKTEERVVRSRPAEEKEVKLLPRPGLA